MKDEFSVYIKGVERLYSICYKDRHIKYLNSFDEFSEKDKKIFEKYMETYTDAKPGMPFFLKMKGNTVIQILEKPMA